MSRHAGPAPVSPATAVTLGLLAGAGGMLAAAAGGWLLYTCLNERIRLLDREVELLGRDAKAVRATLEYGADHHRDTDAPAVVELPAPSRGRALRV